MQLVPFDPPTPALYLAFVMILFAFAAGALIADPDTVRRGRSATYAVPPRSHDETGFVKAFLLATGLIGTVGWVTLLIRFSRQIPLLLLLADLSSLQDRFQTQFVGYANWLNILVPAAFVYLWRRCGYVRWWTVFFVASSLLGLFLAGVKTYIVFGLVAAFMTRFSFDRAFRNVGRIALLAGAVLAFFLVYNVAIDIVVGRGRPAWQWPYIYVAANWPALGEMIRASAPQREGHFGLHVFYSYWKVRNLLQPSPSFPDATLGWVYVPMRWNTYTMQGENFLDFGWPGMFLFTMGFGWLAMKLRLLAVRTDRFTAHLATGLMGYFVFFSFFVNFITHFGTVVFVAYLGLWRVLESRWHRGAVPAEAAVVRAEVPA